jgi:hypothetical protein
MAGDFVPGARVTAGSHFGGAWQACTIENDPTQEAWEGCLCVDLVTDGGRRGRIPLNMLKLIAPAPPSELCEETVKACMAALPSRSFPNSPNTTQSAAYAMAIVDCHSRLEALLPKPDVAKVLVERYIETLAGLEDCEAENLRGSQLQFARHLIASGLINIEKVGEKP